MSLHLEHTLFNLSLSMPWHVALLAGVAFISLRCRHRRATGLAAAGLLLLFCCSVAFETNAHVWLSKAEVIDTEEAGVMGEVVLDGYKYGGPVGLALLIAAAFVGRRPTTPPPSFRCSSPTPDHSVRRP